MWGLLINFFRDKLFHKPQVVFYKSEHSHGDRLCAKRFKFSEKPVERNGFLRQSHTHLSTSMPKENIELSSDEEEDCCVIAEIPRRKKPGQCFQGGSTEEMRSPREILKLNVSSQSPTPPTQRENNKTDGKDIIHNEDLKIYSKNKFFKTPRSLMSQSKTIKSRADYKNFLKKNISCLSKTYRLKEKLQYVKLLQSQTNFNLMLSRPPLKRITYDLSLIPVIDLTEDKVNGSDTSLSPETISSSSDQDVQIVAEVPGVISLKDALKMNNSIHSKHIVPFDHSKHNSGRLQIKGIEENTISLLDDDDNDDDEEEDDVNDDYDKSCSDDLEEKICSFMRITGLKGHEVPKILDDELYLPDLTLEQEKRIKEALVLEPSQEVLVKCFDLNITRRDIQTLKGLNWLNDEIINFYMSLIVERSKCDESLPKVYAFNTFFYPKLVSGGYKSLKRWTKKVDIFSFDIILVPIHLGMHWCLAVIDFRSKSVQYYDSLGSPNNLCLERLLLYLKGNSIDKKKKPFSTADWEKINVKEIPQQMNGSDCGVFSCIFAEHIARDSSILFTQSHMPYFRKKMVIEILDKKLLT